MPDLKKTLTSSLEANNLSSVVLLARQDRQVMGQLVRIAYDKESLAGWRAIEAVGMIARDRIGRDYAGLREMVRKLLWSLSDESGGIGWSAPEIIGEIVSADTDRFADVIPLLVELFSIEERVFRPGVLYALLRIAQSKPSAVKPHVQLAINALDDEDPLVRVHALRLLKHLESDLSQEERESLSIARKTLLSDTAEVWVYQDGTFRNVMIREEL